MSSPDPDLKVNNHVAAQWDEESESLAVYAAQRHIPLAGTFELTARCNLNCKMCYVRLDNAQLHAMGRELTAREWISLAGDAAKAGTLNLLLTGGEPLLRPDFPEIYRALNQMGFIITLYTNATLMTPDLYRLFAEYPPTSTAVTLYGARPQTYEKICGNADAFRQAIQGLEMFADIPTALEVRSTFITDNMDELDELRSLANRYTKRFAVNISVFKAVRGGTADVEACRMTPLQSFALVAANEEYYRSLNNQLQLPLQSSLDTDHYISRRQTGFELSPEIIPCLAAKSMYWITWDGKMLPCGSFSSPYTLPRDEGFLAAWTRLPVLFKDIALPTECLDCEYSEGACPNCPANLQAETGFLNKVSPYICEYAREQRRCTAKYLGQI